MFHFLRRASAPYVEAFSRWQKDDGLLMAAAVAYYAALSVLPMLLVLVSGLGIFLETTALGKDAEQQLIAAVGERTSPELAAQVQQALDQVQQQAVVGGPLGIGGLILGALVIFAQFERAFDRIWNIPVPESGGILRAVWNLLVGRFRAFVMLSGLGLVLIVLFLANMTLTTIQRYIVDLLPYAAWLYWALQLAISITVNALVLAAIYKWLPKVPVRWNEALRGGLLAALIWEGGRLVLAWLVIGERNAYGMIGAFIAVLLWIYYAVAVIFYGAEYVQTICRRCDTSNGAAKTSPAAAPSRRLSAGA